MNKFAQQFLLSLNPKHRTHDTQIKEDFVEFSWFNRSCVLDVKVFFDGWIHWQSTIDGNRDDGVYHYNGVTPSNLQNLLREVAERLN